VQQAGHLGYANDFIPVFHPDFESACDAAAQKLAATNRHFSQAVFQVKKPAKRVGLERQRSRRGK